MKLLRTFIKNRRILFSIFSQRPKVNEEKIVKVCVKCKYSDKGNASNIKQPFMIAVDSEVRNIIVGNH